MTRKRFTVFFGFLSLLLTLMVATSVPAVADGHGYSDNDGLVPGEGGYKVFGPNAIQIVPIKVVDSEAFLLSTLYRAGYSDAYNCGVSCYGGSHTSQSDLVEQENWVDGGLKQQSDTGWRDSCTLHQGGQFSNCNTQALLTVPIIAHSWHHFHTSGYVDDNFETEDSYS